MKNIIITSLLLNILIVFNMFSQTNSDSLFQVAIQQSKNKDYENAIKTAEKVLEIHPSRSDVALFIANVYAWQKNFDKSKEYINNVYVSKPENNELYDSWLNVLLWNKEYEELLKIADIAEKHNYKNDYNLIRKRMTAYKYLGKYSSGIELVNKEQNKIFLDSSKVYNLYSELQLLNKQKKISASYSVDYFDKNSPLAQHLAYLDYAFKIKQNTLIFRVNYANRFNKNGVQIESDYYQKFKNSKYLYLNYGVSVVETVFPKHRAGIEFYFPLTHKFEASIGARYLNFPSKDVFIATGNIAKYIKSFWISARPFVSFKDSTNSISGILNIRKYASNPDNYWELELGYGNSPDDRFIINTAGDYFRLESYKVKLRKNISLTPTNELKLGLGYANEEFFPDKRRNRYTFDIIFKHRF